MAKFTAEFTIPADHPSLQGHFPDNPIVPGSVILDYVRWVMTQWHASIRINTFVQVKFLQPLAPEQAFRVFVVQIAQDMYKFHCETSGHKLVTGVFSITEKS